MNTVHTKIQSKVEHKTLELDGYQIHYYISGAINNSSILFLHPAFSDHRAFANQIDYFSKNYRVITIDLLGHGLSKANTSKDKIDVSTEHIVQILEQEYIPKIHLVGVSVGSLIAQYFALKHPNKVQSLTALGGYSIHEKNETIKKAQRLANLGLVFRALFSMNAFRSKTAKITCYSKEGQTLFYESSSLFERKSFKVMPGVEYMIDNRNNLNIAYPMYILVGEYDIDLAKQMALKWHKDVPHSSYFVLKDAGHCANLDKPNAFNKILNQFIEGIQ